EVQLHGAAETALVGRELGRELARCVVDGERAVALARQVPPGRTARPGRLRVDIGAQPATAASGCPAPCRKIAGSLDAQLSWAHGDDPAPASAVTGDATPVGGNVDGAVAAVAMKLEDALCADLGARVGLWAADDLRPALTGADPGLALWALQLVAARP